MTSCSIWIKLEVKVNQSTCIAPCMVQTTLKCSSMDHTAFNLQRTPCLLLPHKRLPDGASTECGGKHLIAAHYSFIDPGRMKGWVGLFVVVVVAAAVMQLVSNTCPGTCWTSVFTVPLWSCHSSSLDHRDCQPDSCRPLGRQQKTLNDRTCCMVTKLCLWAWSLINPHDNVWLFVHNTRMSQMTDKQHIINASSWTLQCSCDVRLN